ncbi:hypothetical protein D7X33_45905, partial [Butyricicoccus sp. 1XD8-22]
AHIWVQFRTIKDFSVKKTQHIKILSEFRHILSKDWRILSGIQKYCPGLKNIIQKSKILSVIPKYCLKPGNPTALVSKSSSVKCNSFVQAIYMKLRVLFPMKSDLFLLFLVSMP